MSRRLMIVVVLVLVTSMTAFATMARAATPLDEARAAVEQARTSLEALSADITATQARADAATARFWANQDAFEASELRIDELQADIEALDLEIDGIRDEVSRFLINRYMDVGDETSFVFADDLNSSVRAEALASFASADRIDAVTEFENLIDARAERIAVVEAEVVTRQESADRLAADRLQISQDLASLGETDAELAQRLETLQSALAVLEEEQRQRVAAAEEARRIEAERQAAEEAARAAAAQLRAVPTVAEVPTVPAAPAETAPTATPLAALQQSATGDAPVTVPGATAIPAANTVATAVPAAPAVPAAGAPAVATTPAAAPTATVAAAAPAPTAAPAPAAVSSGTMAAGWTCPLAGPFSHTDDFLSPRAVGGWHKANDLIADTGVPVIAVIGGALEHRGNSVGGMSAHLKGDDGNYYYYTHLSGYANEGIGHVTAGTVIGYVGETGNAPIPHLHFEIHQGTYGNYINPYPVIREYCF